MPEFKPVYEIDQIIGRRVREIRLARGLTIRELSEDMGLSLPYLGTIERGQKRWKAYQIQAAADALKIPLNLLCDPLVPVERIDEIAAIQSHLRGMETARLQAVLRILEAL